MKLSLIFASTENDVISDDGSVEWAIPADLKRFRNITWGNTVIMGRTTFEKIGHPLEGRKNIVLTSNKDYRAEGAQVYQSIVDVLPVVADEEEVFVMGGAKTYEQALKYADKIYATRVHTESDGKTKFSFDERSYELVELERHKADKENPFDYTYLTYVRK